MKTATALLGTFLLTLWSAVCVGQSLPKQAAIGVLRYQQVTATLDTSKRFGIPFELRFNQYESLSVPIGVIKRLTPNDTSRLSVKPNEISKQWVYKNLRIKQMKSLQKADMELVVVDDTIVPINWSLKNEFRTIGTLSCQKAEATTRGRHYTAWFAIEIPVSTGPWKLQGLPGLILEAHDDTGEVAFLFEALQMPVATTVQISVPDAKPGIKVLSESAYWPRSRENNERFDKMINARPGMDGATGKSSIKGIELPSKL